MTDFLKNFLVAGLFTLPVFVRIIFFYISFWFQTQKKERKSLLNSCLKPLFYAVDFLVVWQKTKKKNANFFVGVFGIPSKFFVIFFGGKMIVIEHNMNEQYVCIVGKKYTTTIQTKQQKLVNIKAKEIEKFHGTVKWKKNETLLYTNTQTTTTACCQWIQKPTTKEKQK